MIHLDNSTKKHGVIGVIVAALTATALCQSLWADETAGGYEMSYIANQARGSLVADGLYQRAIDGLAGGSHDHLAKYLNLCVAQVIAGQHRGARRSCNRAVELSEQAGGSAPANLVHEHQRNLAVALSNRGVLRAIRGQQGAEDDFRRAIESPIRLDVAARNLDRFNGTNDDVLVAVDVATELLELSKGDFDDLVQKFPHLQSIGKEISSKRLIRMRETLSKGLMEREKEPMV